VIKKFILSAIVIVSIIGCSDKKEETVEKKPNITKEEKVIETLTIEVEQNTNANEIKVEEKTKTQTENGTFYYDYNVKDKNKIETKPRTTLDANMHVRSPYERVKVSLLVKKLSKDFIVKCSACHNDYANGIIGPSLLEKNSDFIFNKIMEFKKDETKNVLMSGLVKQMSEEEIKKIAKEIYRFNQELKEMK